MNEIGDAEKKKEVRAGTGLEVCYYLRVTRARPWRAPGFSVKGESVWLSLTEVLHSFTPGTETQPGPQALLGSDPGAKEFPNTGVGNGFAWRLARKRSQDGQGNILSETGKLLSSVGGDTAAGVNGAGLPGRGLGCPMQSPQVFLHYSALKRNGLLSQEKT